MFRGKDVQDIKELKRQGCSIQKISGSTGFDRKTVRKYLNGQKGQPVYGPRAVQESKLDAFKDYLNERMQAGVWNAQVLLREIRGRDYHGGYTILKDWLHPQRESAQAMAVRRFETPPGKQAQVDWGHLGWLHQGGQERQMWAFTMTLGYSRVMFAEAALDQKLGTLLRMHEAAFQQWGGVPQEVLYDRMKTVWTDTDERGEIVWNSVFLDFARYWGFTPRLGRPYRAQTKGKVESSVKYVRRNFLCGLQGREPGSMPDLNVQLREWVSTVANQRVHGTTREQVSKRWEGERLSLTPAHGRVAYPHVDQELRKVARDAYVAWQGSRYSVPWKYAGKQVWVLEAGCDVEVRYGGERIAIHGQAAGRHQVITRGEHHQGIPLGPKSSGKTLIDIQQGAPVVEVRSLQAYESAALGGAQ